MSDEHDETAGENVEPTALDTVSLRIPTRLRPVVLWVHPEGRVVGSLFVHDKSPLHDGPETPLDVLNRDAPFVVVRRDDPEEIRFYNRASIIRVELDEGSRPPLAPGVVHPLTCVLHMMDGSAVEGTVMKSLPADRARFFDLLNQPEPFVKLYLESQRAVLINKAFVIYGEDATPRASSDEVSAPLRRAERTRERKRARREANR